MRMASFRKATKRYQKFYNYETLRTCRRVFVLLYLVNLHLSHD